jgi:hypothetical protein
MVPRGEVHRLGRRHVPRHAPRRVPAVDRQEEHVERLLSQLLGQPVIRQAVSTIIQPEPLGLDDVPQIKMTVALITVDLLVCRRDSSHPEPGPLDDLARVGSGAAMGSRPITLAWSIKLFGSTRRASAGAASSPVSVSGSR